MSELAFNINGEAFEVPANASGWRVRRMRAKGSPEVVYGRDGLPLVLPISAEMEDLRSEVDTTGRYRLDLVDGDNKPIASVPSGYVQVNFETQQAGGETKSQALACTKQSDNIVLEAMRMQSMIATSVIERFPQMMEAAATLLRAADGAGLPARQPRTDIVAENPTEEEDDEDDDTPASSPTVDLLTALMQFAPIILPALKGKSIPKLDAMLDWRKAAPKPSRELAPATAEASDATVTSTTEAEPEVPAIDAAMMAKVAAIQAALTPAEAARALKLAGELTPAERYAYFTQLSGMSVPEAVAKVRSLIGGAP